MQALAMSLGYDCSVPGLANPPSFSHATNDGNDDDDDEDDDNYDACFRNPVPTQFIKDNAGTEMLNSAAWLDYFDACLRERGVKGGLVEFEEFARLSSQGAVMTASMSAVAGGTSGSSSRMMPQDRSPPLGSSCDKDEVEYLPIGFEYDEIQFTSDTNDIALARRREAEEEELLRTKKTAKKRDKKARQKERARREAEVKAALAAMKKREKAITSWRSRVVAACSAGDAKKMDLLVGESPYKNYVYDPKSLCFDDDDEEENDAVHDEKHDDRPKSQEEYLLKQMEWFLPNCLQKYRTLSAPTTASTSEFSPPQAQPYANNLAREKLANYILSVSFDIVLQQSTLSQNRNAIHSAAYMGDVDFIRWVIRSQSSKTKKDDVSYLEDVCSDAGWTPLHYATAAGESNVVELLLQEGVCATATTDSSLTCLSR